MKLEEAARALLDAIDSGAVLRDDPDELWRLVEELRAALEPEAPGLDSLKAPELPSR